MNEQEFYGKESHDFYQGIIKGKQEAIKEVLKIKEQILEQRRYLPSKENIGTMDYWIGDNNKNKGIYVDLGGVIGKIDKLIQALKQEKTK